MMALNNFAEFPFSSCHYKGIFRLLRLHLELNKLFKTITIFVNLRLSLVSK